MQRNLQFKRFYPYPAPLVWRAIAEADLLGRWFMPNDFEPVLHRDFTFRKDPQPGWNGITYCTVTELDPPHRVAYTYRGYAGGDKALACAGIHSEAASSAVKGIFTELDTVLRFTLIEENNGTTLLLEHSGFSGLKLAIISIIMGMGWKNYCANCHLYWMIYRKNSLLHYK